MSPGARILVDLWAVVVGLVTGSYLNVVVHRLPRGLSTVLPRSRCPACSAPIRALDNLPVVSWLLLRGRCRHCGAAISWRYPLIEGATATLFLACAERFGLSVSALAAALFCCLMIVLAAIDVEHLLLPDRITLPGILAGVAIQPFVALGLPGASFRARLAAEHDVWPAPWPGPLGALLGALLGGAVLLAAYGAWWLLRREEGLGLGDVKMLAMIGAFLGWRGVVVALLSGAFAGSAVGLGLLAAGRGGMKSKLPFGAFLAFGGLVALFYGPALVAAYLETAFGIGRGP